MNKNPLNKLRNLSYVHCVHLCVCVYMCVCICDREEEVNTILFSPIPFYSHAL